MPMHVLPKTYCTGVLIVCNNTLLFVHMCMCECMREHTHLCGLSPQEALLNLQFLSCVQNSTSHRTAVEFHQAGQC